MKLESVGFKPPDPNEQRERILEALQKLKDEQIKARQAFNTRRMKELDTALINAWMIRDEIETRLKDI